jgi:hypothetical protein
VAHTEPPDHDWLQGEYDSDDDQDGIPWDDAGFDTPEEAAAPEIPSRYVRVVDVSYSPDGKRAVVDLLTNEEPYVYPYTVHCRRDASGRWHEAGGHN